jgi:hypothetical protein
MKFSRYRTLDAANRDPLEQLMKHRGGMTIRRKSNWAKK